MRDMNYFRLIGPHTFRTGQFLHLSAEMISLHRLKLSVPQDWDGKTPAQVEVIEPIDLKSGFEVGFPEVTVNNMECVIKPAWLA